MIGDDLRLVDRYPDLNIKQDWPRLLSLGEQQRLAFARLLLNAPRYAVTGQNVRKGPWKSEQKQGFKHYFYNMCSYLNWPIDVTHERTRDVNRSYDWTTDMSITHTSSVLFGEYGRTYKSQPIYWRRSHSFVSKVCVCVCDENWTCLLETAEHAVQYDCNLASSKQNRIMESSCWDMLRWREDVEIKDLRWS